LSPSPLRNIGVRSHFNASHLASRITFTTHSISIPADESGVGGGLNTLAWTGSMPPDFQVFLAHPDVNVLVSSVSDF
jgi:hypothetical protein